MKLEVGKFYRTRDGKKVEIVFLLENPILAAMLDIPDRSCVAYQIEGTNFYLMCHLNGRVSKEVESPLDLVAVWEEPELVPLDPEDVPPGSAIRYVDWRGWEMLLSVQKDSVTTVASKKLTFVALFSYDWQIRRPGEDWMPCKKEKTHD